MARPKKTDYNLKRGITSVMKSGAEVPPKLVISGNDYPSGKKRRQVIAVRAPTQVLSVKDNLLRIQTEADPMGFLISAQKGDLIACHYVDEEGNIVTKYEQAALADRISIAKFLVNKVLPNLTVTKHLVEQNTGDPEAPVRPGSPGQPSFAQIVSAAASRGYGADAEVVEGVVEDGGTSSNERDDADAEGSK
jgi:hypothetical protein